MKLPPKVILHVGMAKAGSTSIQNALDANRTTLLDHGFLFPASVFTRLNPIDQTRTSGHLELMKRMARDDLASFYAECAKYEGQVHTLILSTEGLLFNQSDQALKNLAVVLSGCDITILAVLRAQIPWALSRYGENVLGGWHLQTSPLKQFLAQTLETGQFDYASRLTYIAEIFSAKKTIALDFDALSKSDTLVSEVFREIDITSFIDLKTANRKDNIRTVYPEVIETMRRLNLFARKLKTSDVLSWISQTNKLRQDIITRDGLLPGFGELPQEFLSEIEENIKRLNTQLRRKFPSLAQFGQASVPSEALRKPRENAVQEMTRGALGALSQIVHREQHVPARPQELSRCLPDLELTREEIEAVFSLYQSTSVILECGVCDTTLLASTFPGKLIYCIPDATDNVIDFKALLDRSKYPSPVHFVSSDDVKWSDRSRHPDIIRMTNAGQDDDIVAIGRAIRWPTRLLYRAGDAQNSIARLAPFLQPEQRIGRYIVARLEPGPD